MAAEPLITDGPAEGFRPCVGLMVLDGQGRVLVGERSDLPGAWQMPQGGIDPGETPIEAAWRELREEIGTDRAALLAECPAWLAYELPPELARRAFGGRFRGQTQKWLAFRFLGTEADLDPDRDGPHGEFRRFRWVDRERLLEDIVAFKRPIYRRVVDAFRHLWA
jgi:putative (di)nucleoside polyphosphate hydrolase